MSNSLKTIAARELGQFPLSVPTSLAIEALADIHPEKPTKHPGEPLTIDSIDSLWVNVRTLYRNLMSSLGPDHRGKTHPEDVYEALQVEMTSLTSVIDKIAHGRVKVTFYICKYENLEKVFPNAIINFGKPKTKLQVFDFDHEQNTLRPFLREKSRARVLVFDVYPRTEESSRNGMMLTHYPLDLTHRYDFKRLYLLESRTGVIKTHTQFHTKLRTAPEDAHIPFTVGTMQVFGDTGKLFGLQSSAVRDYVTRCANVGKWTAATSFEKMQFTIKQNPLEKIQDLALKLLRA